MKIDNNKLDKVIGGSVVTSSIISSITGAVSMIIDIGRGLGSSIRRMQENKICPIE